MLTKTFAIVRDKLSVRIGDHHLHSVIYMRIKRCCHNLIISNSGLGKLLRVIWGLTKSPSGNVTPFVIDGLEFNRYIDE